MYLYETEHKPNGSPPTNDLWNFVNKSSSLLSYSGNRNLLQRPMQNNANISRIFIHNETLQAFKLQPKYDNNELKKVSWTWKFQVETY